MGLFDWLSGGGGDLFGSNMPFIDASRNYIGPGAQPDNMPMPPVQMTGVDAQPPMPGPYPQGGDPMTAGGAPGNGPGLPMPTGTDPMTAGGAPGNGPGLPPGLPPIPPSEASAAARTPPGLPPPMTPAEGQGIVKSYEGAGGNAFAPPGAPHAQTMIGRALGLDPNRESQIRGSLGAGLKAVGENYSKPGLAAFAGTAGAGIEGGKKADDKTTEQQDKYLQRAIQAKREGNQAAYQQNYLRYQIEATKVRLAQAKEKAAGKDSVMNSPEQLYLRGVGATNADGELKILANKAKEAEKIGDAKAAKEAMDAYNKRRQEVLDGHLKTLGVDPNKVKGIESKPGFSEKTPFKDFDKDPAKAQKQFDALPDGAYFINPKDGRLLTKKSAAGAGTPNPAQPQQAELAPPMPPMPMTPETEAA